MSEKVVGHVKVYALDLTDELIKGKGVASESGQSVATREIGQRHWKNRMKDVHLHNIHNTPRDHQKLTSCCESLREVVWLRIHA